MINRDDLRKQKEAEFHSKREWMRQYDPESYAEITKNKKFYSITKVSENFFDEWLKKKCPSKKLLDYCCGTGGVSIKAAQYGATVIGIDISAEEIKTCEKKAAETNMQDKTSFLVMDAEDLLLEKKSIDLIVCTCVWHRGMRGILFQTANVSNMTSFKF